MVRQQLRRSRKVNALLARALEKVAGPEIVTAIVADVTTRTYPLCRGCGKVRLAGDRSGPGLEYCRRCRLDAVKREEAAGKALAAKSMAWLNGQYAGGAADVPVAAPAEKCTCGPSCFTNCTGFLCGCKVCMDRTDGERP